MTMTPMQWAGVLLSYTLAVIGAVIAHVRVEGRVNTLQALFDRVEKRLERMEEKIDALECNPHHHQ